MIYRAPFRSHQSQLSCGQPREKLNVIFSNSLSRCGSDTEAFSCLWSSPPLKKIYRPSKIEMLSAKAVWLRNRADKRNSIFSHDVHSLPFYLVQRSSTFRPVMDEDNHRYPVSSSPRGSTYTCPHPVASYRSICARPDQSGTIAGCSNDLISFR